MPKFLGNFFLFVLLNFLIQYSFRAIFREQVVAVKQMKARDDSQRQIEEFKKEVLALRSVKSPYVIKLLGICFKPKLVMVMVSSEKKLIFASLSKTAF